MSMKLLHCVRVAFKNEAGQILPWIAVSLVAALGVTGLAIDMGHAYIVQSQLQIGANAAALAGAQVLPDDPTFVATQYSGKQAGDNNYSTVIGAVTTSVHGKCLSLLKNNGVPCLTPSFWNAVQVTQSVDVPTLFMRALNFLPGVHLNNIPVSATATAGRSKPFPVNVAIILDMTGSLDVPELNDPSCIGHQEFQCQLYAVQAMLKTLDPCSDGSRGSNCTAALANVRVGLFMFPNISSAAVSDQINCGAGGADYPLVNTDKKGNKTNDPTNPYAITKIIPVPYTFPMIGAADYTNAGLNYTYTPPPKSTVKAADINATYQVVSFSTDYYDPGQPNGLNPNSDLVKAVGQGSGAIQGCLNFPSGIVNSNTSNTYLASSIYAAQAALIGEQARHTKPSTNYIIFISDGVSNVASLGDSNQMVSTSGGSIRSTLADSGKPLYQVAPGQWPIFGTVSSATGLTALTGTGDYPDSNDQCQQAMMAGTFASSKGTIVSAVANGAPGTGGCLDSTVVAKGTLNVKIAAKGDVTACNTMKNVATSLDNFYSTTSTGCKDLETSHGAAGNLQAIFEGLSFGLVRATLIPNSAN